MENKPEKINEITVGEPEKEKETKKSLEPKINPKIAKKNTKRYNYSKANKQKIDIIEDEEIQETLEKTSDKRNNVKKTIVPILKKADETKLAIGKDISNNKIVYMNEKQRTNTMIVGLASTGKSTQLLPSLLNQEFQNKNVGCTIFVSNEDIAFKLFALARYYRRQVKMIKPSTDLKIVNQFLWMKEYSYKYIKEEIIDFETAIEKKHIVIIDMEQFRYKNFAQNAVNKLLLQYQIEMYNAFNNPNKIKKPENHLYVDDAHLYMEGLKEILEYGKDYKVLTTILLKSTSLLNQKEEDYRAFVEANIQDYIYMNKLSVEDMKACRDRNTFVNQKVNFRFPQKYNEILYKRDLATIYSLEPELEDAIDRNAKKLKRKMINFNKKTESNHETQNKKASNLFVEVPKENFEDVDNVQNILDKAEEPMAFTDDDFNAAFDNAIGDELIEDVTIDEEEAKETPIDRLSEEERKIFDEINENNNILSIRKQASQRKEFHEVVEDLFQNRHYINPDDLDFEDC